MDRNMDNGEDWWTYIRWASEHHLTVGFPDKDFHSDEWKAHGKRLEWVREHEVGRNEYRDAECVFEDINILALSADKFFKRSVSNGHG